MKIYRSKLWSKDFLIISAIHFLISLIFYILMVTIAVYASEEYGALPSQAGLITGFFIIGALIGRLFIGHLIDSIGRKRTLFIGLFFFTLTTLLYFINISIYFLLFSRFIHGVAIGVTSTAAGTIVAQIIPKKQEGKGISYYSMSKTLATAVGPFIGLLMSQHTSYQMIFGCCLLLGIISLITASFISIPPVGIVIKTDERSKFKLTNFIEPNVLPIAIIVLAISFCYSSVLSFINLYAIEIGLIKAATFFFVVYSITVLLSRPFTGILMDRKGANFVMYPAFVIFSTGMFLLSTANSAFSLLIASILIGLGFGNMQSITQAITIKLISPNRMGIAISTFFIFVELGLGFGPYLIGIIISLTGFRSLYIIISILVFLTAFLYYFLHGKKEHVARSKEIIDTMG